MVHTVPLDERHVPSRRLGRHIEHDERSRAYPVRRGCNPLARYRKPRTVEWTRRVPIFNQGTIGSCTGQAMAGVLGTDSASRRGNPGIGEGDAVALYESATSLDDIPGRYPPDDTGSSGLAVMKAAHKLGYLAGYRHAFTWRQVLAALQTGPAITGITWREGCDEPDRHGRVTYEGEPRGGHEVEVIGVDVAGELVKFANSWGPGWGLGGCFFMTFTDYKAALADGGDFTQPIWA